MDTTALFCRECIANMANFDFAIYTGLSVAAALFFLRRCQRQFHRSRLVADMPTSRIRSASQGYTELVGIARKDEHPNIAPLSGELCLWWRYTIEKYQQSGKTSHWVTVEKKYSQARFLLEDLTGTCVVEPTGAEISSLHKRSWYGSTRRPTNGSAKANQHFFAASVSLFGRRYRYTEYLIKEGDPLYALGHFGSDRNTQQTMTIEQLTGDILRSWKEDYSTLVSRFDTDSDGRINQDEWLLVRQAAKNQAQEERSKALEITAENHLSQPAIKGLPFIISSHEQQRLGSRFRNGALLAAISFLLAGSMAAWLLSNRLIIN